MNFKIDYHDFLNFIEIYFALSQIIFYHNLLKNLLIFIIKIFLMSRKNQKPVVFDEPKKLLKGRLKCDCQA